MAESNITTAAAPTTVPARRNGGGAGTAAHLALRSPREELAHISQLMDDFARRVFGYPSGRSLLGANWLDRLGGLDANLLESLDEEPQIDVYEKDDAYQLFIALPGYSAEQIHVETAADGFVIHGEREGLRKDEDMAARQKSGVTSERRFRIEATLPCETDPSKTAASFTNGVLEVRIPKTEKSRTKTVQVPIQTR